MKGNKSADFIGGMERSESKECGGGTEKNQSINFGGGIGMREIKIWAVG